MQGAVSSTDVTRVGVYGQPVGVPSEAARTDGPTGTGQRHRPSFEDALRPKTQGKQRSRERSLAAGRSPPDLPNEPLLQAAPRSITIQNFIRRLFGWARPRVDIVTNKAALVTEGGSLSPSRLREDLEAGRDADSLAVKLEPRQWANLSQAGAHYGATANEARVEDGGSS